MAKNTTKTNIKPKFQPATPSKPSAVDLRSKHRPTGPGKTFHKDGHWIENPHKTAIVACACGNRYIKTRHGQTKCLRCISLGK